MHIEELETPIGVVDLDRLTANIERLQSYLASHDIDNRPHIKTHRIPAIAHMQMEAGAVGITCQTLSEAEVMCGSGIRDIFLPYNLLSKTKLRRLMLLSRRAEMSVTADSARTVAGYAEAAAQEGAVLPVLIEMDGGYERCGVTTPEGVRELARQIDSASHLHFGGLMVYPSNPESNAFMGEAKMLLAQDGLAVERVSGGSSFVMWQAHEFTEMTEHRAGMYVYGDRNLVDAGAMQLEDCSYVVLATVVSRPTEDRVVLDSGSKSLAADGARQSPGHGLIVEYPQAEIFKLSEEHGHVDVSRCARKPEIGERVSVLVNHCCVSNNLFQRIVGHRKGEVELEWPVLAKGW
ncbi:MAG: D-TA family PLP-dependent enzyme [Caldilineaceae bacterium SB0665_bin_25]|nr:D-TA family PLP-dependent enzyme [Caldilineaceae bacterium SB0665_bin_25]